MAQLPVGKPMWGIAMLKQVSVLLIALLGSSTVALAQSGGSASIEVKTCPIAVEIYGAVARVNMVSYLRLRALLDTPKYQQLKIETYLWGMEGERTWCISNAENHPELFDELQTIIRDSPTTRESKPGIFKDRALKGAKFLYQGLPGPKPYDVP